MLKYWECDVKRLRAIHRAAPAAALLMLAACAQPMLTQVTVTGAPLPQDQRGAQLAAPANGDALSRQAGALVADGLRAQGFTVGDNQRWIVHAAVGVRDPGVDVGLDDDRHSPPTLDWMPSLPVRGGDRHCDPRNLMLTVSILDAHDGAVVRRASVARIVCAAGVEAALPDLVDIALTAPDSVRIKEPRAS